MKRRFPATSAYTKDELPRQVAELEQRLRQHHDAGNDDHESLAARVSALEERMTALEARVTALEP